MNWQYLSNYWSPITGSRFCDDLHRMIFYLYSFMTSKKDIDLKIILKVYKAQKLRDLELEHLTRYWIRLKVKMNIITIKNNYCNVQIFSRKQFSIYVYKAFTDKCIYSVLTINAKRCIKSFSSTLPRNLNVLNN